MVYDVINKICKNAKMNHEPFYNSVELRGDLILLFRDKLVKESETKKSLMYEKYIEWKETKNNEVIEEIERVSAADVRAISEELFRPEYMGLTVLGDIDRDALASINMDC